jgi:hypothetical protein
MVCAMAARVSWHPQRIDFERIYKVKVEEFAKNRLTEKSLREGKELLGMFLDLYEEEGFMII